MECLWDHAPQTMGEITATLEPATGWTRQTVITLLKRMAEKGAVSMDDNGRAKKYNPLIMVNQLVDSGDLSAEDLQEILKTMCENGK